MLTTRSTSKAIWVLVLLTASTAVELSAAQQSSQYIVRIFNLTMSRYTCTALTGDYWLEQVTISLDRGIPEAPEIRAGLATDDEVKKIDQLVAQPQIRAATSGIHRPSAIVKSDGRWLLVLTDIDGEPRTAEFLDPDGAKSMPDYLKGFDAFAEAIRHRKLPKLAGKVKPVCSLRAK